MNEMIERFGIALPQLLAHIIIFLIVYLILKKMAFGPILSLLEERRNRIAEAEANFVRSRSDLSGAEARAAEIIAKANADAERLIKEAAESAAAVGEKKRQEASTEAAAIIAKAREAGKIEQDRALTDLKRDFGRLVIETTQKITGKVLNSDDHNRINQEAAAQIAG